MPYTTDEIVADVQGEAMIPNAHGEITPVVIVGILNDVISRVIVPWERRMRGTERRVVSTDFALAADTATYRIPATADAGGLRDVAFVNSDGDEIEMEQVSLDEVAKFASTASPMWGAPYAFCVEGHQVRVLPTPTQADGSIRMKYFRRPGRLVLVEDAMQITLVTYLGGGTGFEALSVPATFSTSTPLDVIQASPGFDVFHSSQLPLDVAPVGPPIGVSFLPMATTEAVAGDYIALAGETPVVQLAPELHPILTALAAARVEKRIGDRDGARLSFELAMRDLENMAPLFRSRVQDKPRYGTSTRAQMRGGRS